MSVESLSQARVLIIDDDPLIGRMARALVGALGATAQTYLDITSFLTAHDSWHPTHVMIDLVLGDTDGLVVLEELAKRNSHAAVIISSGMEGRVLQSALRYADARGLTIAGILAKPYSRDQLQNLLELGLNATAPTNAPLPAPIPEEPETPERTLLKALRSALHHNEVNLAIQPKVACATGVVVGFEALARWNRPGFGPVSPGIFVPIAERNGLAAELTETIGLQALTWFKESHQSTDRYMALNVSATEVGDADLDVHLMSLCERTGVEPANVTIEITETAAMADPVTSLERLTRLRLEGFRLSMDDFGTGYSSMRELVRLPFSELKIDQGFVTTAAESHQSTAVVRSIIELAHSLGMTCTAEGVEDAATMDLLVSLECDVAQGFHLGLPMAPAGLAIWLKNMAAATGAPQP